MTRVFFAAALIATALIPQVLEAQLFQRNGLRGRGFRNFAPQQRTPILQNQRGLLSRTGSQAQPTPRKENQQSQLRQRQTPLGTNFQQLQSVLQPSLNRMQIRPSTTQQQRRRNQSTNPNRGGDQAKPLQSNRLSPTDSSLQPQMVRPGERPSQSRTLYSILETPDQPRQGKDEAEEIEPVLELPEKSGTEVLEQTKTSLDITTPPIEPVEEIQNNSILKIVDPPKALGKK